jgi:endonuclease/exonuclease/phosphatase family metal-dependent hydrolase
MGRIRLLALCSALVFAAGCSDTSPVGPSATSAAKDDGLLTNEAWYGGAGPGAMPIRIYQQNVYPGFDIDSVAAALTRGPDAFLTALVVGLTTFDNTNWRERAARMVLEIQQHQPDVVSLNEMITLERNGFGLLYASGIVPIDIPDDTTDFLSVFQEELAKRHLPYELVDSLPLTDAPVDLSGFFSLPPGTIAARYQDRDVMFVREDVGVASITTDTFDVELLVPPVPQLRGWIAADLTARGKTWHFVTTHPDPSWPANGKTPHVQQLIASVANVTNPVIIAGDLNLEPSWPEHIELVTAGFVDLWTSRLGPAPSDNPNGFTCCELDPALRNPQPTLTKRIDYVMARPASGYSVGPVRFLIFGDDLAERTATGMWPADHAGLLVGLVMQHE